MCSSRETRLQLAGEWIPASEAEKDGNKMEDHEAPELWESRGLQMFVLFFWLGSVFLCFFFCCGALLLDYNVDISQRINPNNANERKKSIAQRFPWSQEMDWVRRLSNWTHLSLLSLLIVPFTTTWVTDRRCLVKLMMMHSPSRPLVIKPNLSFCPAIVSLFIHLSLSFSLCLSVSRWAADALNAVDWFVS